MQVQGEGDPEIARIATAQRGLVIREQLLAAGLRRGAITHRLKTGRLHPVHRGVYLVGHASMGPLGEEMAAVLFLRGRGVLSHSSAAAVWGLLDSRSSEVSLTVVRRDSRSKPGLRLFRATQLDRRDLRVRAGLPVTSPARTILDLAGEASEDELERVVAEARVRSLVRDRELRAALARAPGRKGSGRLRGLLDSETDPAYTRSDGERRLLRLVREARLPPPVANVPLCGYKVDLLWPAQRLVVEVDGYPFHGHRAAFERDRRKDQALVAAGYRVIRVTGRQLRHEPYAVIARIAQALAREAA